MRDRPVGYNTPLPWLIGGIAVLVLGGLSGVATDWALRDNALHDRFQLGLLTTLNAALGFSGVAVWYYMFPTIKGYGHSRLLAGIQFWMMLAGTSVWVLSIVLTSVIAAKATDASAVRLLWYWCTRIGFPVLAAGFLLFLVNMVLTFVRRRPGT